MARFAVVYGAPTPPGRLASLAAVARDRAVTHSDASVGYVDLSAVQGTGPLGDDAADLVRTIADADAVVFTSAVYRASIPGVLKCLLDELPVDALKFKPVGIVVMGGSLHHYLAVDSHLRDVLAWFGALVAPVSVYATGKSFGDDGAPLGEVAAEIDLLVDGLASLTSASVSGPEPLAAKAW